MEFFNVIVTLIFMLTFCEAKLFIYRFKNNEMKHLFQTSISISDSWENSFGEMTENDRQQKVFCDRLGRAQIIFHWYDNLYLLDSDEDDLSVKLQSVQNNNITLNYNGHMMTVPVLVCDENTFVAKHKNYDYLLVFSIIDDKKIQVNFVMDHLSYTDAIKQAAKSCNVSLLNQFVSRMRIYRICISLFHSFNSTEVDYVHYNITTNILYRRVHPQDLEENMPCLKCKAYKLREKNMKNILAKVTTCVLPSPNPNKVLHVHHNDVFSHVHLPVP